MIIRSAVAASYEVKFIARLSVLLFSKANNRRDPSTRVIISYQGI
jgi:hypothetical protein